MEINCPEGNRPEWFMCRGSLRFSQRARFHEGERESIYRCMPTILILTLFFFFWLFSFLPSHLLLFLFPGFSFQIPISSLRFLFFSPPLFTARPSFYSAYHDRILLFQPLTSFVWSGCTGRPSLFRLCATPHYQTKKGIFVCLAAVAPLSCYGLGSFSLSLSLMACT